MTRTPRIQAPFAIATILVLSMGCGGAGSVTATGSDARAQVGAEVSNTPAAVAPGVAELSQWLATRARGEDRAGGEAYYAYYDVAQGRGWFLSSMVTADVARFYLRTGQTETGLAALDSLLSWQHDGQGTHGALLGGAFQSELPSADAAATDTCGYYDSGDNLAIIEAMLDAHQSTGADGYLRAAERAGVWLRDVMLRGHDLGLWVEPHQGFMKAATCQGAFDNRIPVGRSAFWLPTLRRLAVRTGDSSFLDIAAGIEDFLARAQSSDGGFYDHYDPGYPAVPFQQSRFRTAGIDGSVYADDSLRAAIAAVRAGRSGLGERFFDLVSRPVATHGGRVAGYLSFEDGTPLFVAGDTPYADVISSSLFALLAEGLGRSCENARGFVATAQSDNGGYFWGRRLTDDAPISSDQATLTGLWAVVDLSPRS